MRRVVLDHVPLHAVLTHIFKACTSRSCGWSIDNFDMSAAALSAASTVSSTALHLAGKEFARRKFF